STALAAAFASADAEKVQSAALALADELARMTDSDWLEAAARTFASHGAWDRADEAMRSAREHAWNDESRASLDRRWFEHVRELPLEATRLVSEARVSLAEGNNDLACAWADLAAARSPELVEAELLLARAKTVSGDARGAEAILARLAERDLDED